jgi:ubiquinone/menaquinone biosynthesis C-methylase UbiE
VDQGGKTLRSGLTVQFLSRSTEKPLPLTNSSSDTVVIARTLCSIAQGPNALHQVKRVVKPRLWNMVAPDRVLCLPRPADASVAIRPSLPCPSDTCHGSDQGA